jgi:DNA-binding XRE family transcriptional regulator
VVKASGLSEADKGKIERLLRLVSKTSAQMSSFELRVAREASGLSRKQAAKLAHIKLTELVDLETGGWEPSFPGLLSRDFDRIYCLGDGE